jgi:hypothetical protein
MPKAWVQGGDLQGEHFKLLRKPYHLAELETALLEVLRTVNEP